MIWNRAKKRHTLALLYTTLFLLTVGTWLAIPEVANSENLTTASIPADIPVNTNSCKFTLINLKIFNKNKISKLRARISSQNSEYADVYDDILSSLDAYDETTTNQAIDVLYRTKFKILKNYLELVTFKILTAEDIAYIAAHPDIGSKLPSFKQSRAYQLFVRTMKGEVSPEVRSFAYYGSRDLRHSNRRLSNRLKAIANAYKNEIHISQGDAGTVSLLWYPVYPDESPSCTHTKIIVNGTVWSTMGVYKKMKSSEVHEKLASRSVKDSYVEFTIKATPEEIERIQYLLESNDRRGTGLGMCVQGACGALAQSGILRVPPPFNQVPLLAALYLTIRRTFPAGVQKIRFQGKSPFRSMIRVHDVLIDGAIVGQLTLLGYKVSLMFF